MRETLLLQVMWFGPSCKNKTLSLSVFGRIRPILFCFSSPSSSPSLRQQQVLSLDRISSNSCHYTLSFYSPFSFTVPISSHSRCITINRLRDQQPPYFFLLFFSFLKFYTKIKIIIIWIKLSRVSLDCSILYSLPHFHRAALSMCSAVLYSPLQFKDA